MKIAIVGAGISGNLAAYHLHREHEVTVFEAEQRIGGHSNTVDVNVQGRNYAIDTGFIVYNDKTYPQFVQLLDELGVATQASEMSFSVRCEMTGLEYNGATINSLFAQRRNLLRPRFYRMLLDILRFNRAAPQVLQLEDHDLTLDEFLQQGKYSPEFIQHYILPMGAAIWSASPQGMGGVPVGFFVRFFHNHGLLSVDDRPTWRVIRGGSRQYVDKLVAKFRDRIWLNSPVEWIQRKPDHVEIKARGQEVKKFDRVFLACHSNQALALLRDASTAERAVLGAMAYQRNQAVLHTDNSLMPRRKRAWAAWNYHLLRTAAGSIRTAAGSIRTAAARDGKVSLSYNMNILQGVKAPVDFLVTLNHRDAIDPAKIIAEFDYDHPVFDRAAVAAQQRQRELNGSLSTYFCGAYWRNGFHEDGVVSAMNAVEHFKQDQLRMQQANSTQMIRAA
jgi:predicted NAD/FAD-binding protein